MATEETYRAVLAVRDAERRIQEAQRDLATARRARDDALRREQDLRMELQRVERSLNVSELGQTRLGGPSQSTFPTGGGKAALLARRKEIRALLTARPDQAAVPSSAPLGRFA